MKVVSSVPSRSLDVLNLEKGRVACVSLHLRKVCVSPEDALLVLGDEGGELLVDGLREEI